MGSGVGSIGQTFIHAPGTQKSSGSGSVSTQNHVLTGMTSAKEPGRAKAADLATRGGFRAGWVSFISSLGAFKSSQLRNEILHKSGALMARLQDRSSYTSNGDSIAGDITQLKSDLEELKQKSPKDYDAVACFLEDAIASLDNDSLNRFVLILEEDQSTSVRDERSSLNARRIKGFEDDAPRKMTLFTESRLPDSLRAPKTFDDNLHFIIGKGIAKNLAAQVVEETKQNPKQGMTGAYDKVAADTAMKCPGLGLHIVTNALIYDFNDKHAQSGRTLDKDFVINHQLRTPLNYRDSAGQYAVKLDQYALEGQAANLANLKLNGSAS